MPKKNNDRVSIIRQKLNGKKCDGFIVSKPANVTYLTGFMGDDSWALITGKNIYLITDSRYTEQAENECPGIKIVERKGPMAPAIAGLIDKQKTVKTIAVENSITLSQLKALKKVIKRKFMPVDSIVENIRREKGTLEANAIIKAANLARQALLNTKRYIKPGVTESETAGRIEFEMRKLGAIKSFDTIGANGSRPHHISGKTRLKKNDSVLIDFGVKLNGYCCDITRCFTVGNASRLFTKTHKAVQEAHDKAIENIKAGVSIKTIDAITRETIKEYGFEPHGHGTGHGLGMEVHELPIVGPNSKGNLQAGDVITIEPGIYIPGKLGIRIEDDVLVTENGYKILSGD